MGDNIEKQPQVGSEEEWANDIFEKYLSQDDMAKIYLMPDDDRVQFAGNVKRVSSGGEDEIDEYEISKVKKDWGLEF